MNDVFLSYKAKDIPASFISHLQYSLSKAGFAVFEDYTELPRVNDISNKPLKSIEGSKISIIIFSNDYASFRWHLEELSKIIELHRTKHQVVLPLFYNVDPSEVCHQTSSFGEAFEYLIQENSATQDEVLRWRAALREAAAIDGFVLQPDSSWNEFEVVFQNIVAHVCHILDKQDLFVIEHPVGVKSRVQQMISLLQSHRSEDVILVGICGIGGIGKTTIAQAIYNEIGPTFDSRSFLSNISGIWKQDDGQVSLQNRLLLDICKTTNMTINSIDSGKSILKDGLCHKRALVVLDDVDHFDQFDGLFGSIEWFGQGSRIIITTRDKHLLLISGVERIYNVKDMGVSESYPLFRLITFREASPKEEFFELSLAMIGYCNGVPLALKSLASLLYGRDVTMWKSILDQMQRSPRSLMMFLKICFDHLSSDETKEIFLNIALDYIGEDKNDVTQMLEARGFPTHIGITELVERSLVTIDKNNKLGMHNLLQDMGIGIMTERSQKEPREQGHRYDVFLSFRGEDTRATFTSHLFSSLNNAGIVVFKDDAEIHRGDHISIKLLRGIESSKISIIIFSREYAGSRWCLEELSKIMELHKSNGQVVIPVFYDVNPSEIRHQTSNFGESFRGLIRRISPPKEQVLKWGKALHEAGGIAGHVMLDSRNESEDIKIIVEHVYNIVDKKDFFVANHPVGVKFQVRDVIEISKKYQSKDVVLVGIWGMGGIGKTTIAKAIYNEIGHTFESRSFLSNIRKVWEQDNGQVWLQNQLLWEICKKKI